MSDRDEQAKFRLYGFFRSSCSGRLRIALHCKGVPFDYVSIDTSRGAQREASYKELNPAGTVPVLIDLRLGADGLEFPISQSIAALEYLEETLPATMPLLPSSSQPLERAKVRTLVEIIADTQPVANRRVAESIAELGGSFRGWMKQQLARGLRSFEGTLVKTAGLYSVGNSLSLADVCLIPAIWNAEQWGVDLTEFPIIWRIYKATSELEAVKKAHWASQSDTPADLSFD